MKNKPTKMKYLAVSVISSLAMIANTAYADVEKKRIGDLEIYAKPSGDTSPSLLLMLDFSGSMWEVSDPKGKFSSSHFAIPIQESVPKNKRLNSGYTQGAFGWHNKDVVYTAPASEKKKIWAGGTAKCDWGYSATFIKATKTYEVDIFRKNNGNMEWYNPSRHIWQVYNDANSHYVLKDGSTDRYVRDARKYQGEYQYFCKKEYGPVDNCKLQFGSDVSVFSEGKSYTYTDPDDPSKTFTVKLPIDHNIEIGKDFVDGSALYGHPYYGLSGCQVNTSQGKKTYNRVSTLKDALLTLLTSNQIDNKVRFGLGTYSALKGNQDNNTNPIQRFGRTGTVMVPVKPLTFEHRKLLVEKIVQLVPSGNTPMAPALAESGAYMFGTSTMDKADTLDAQSDGTTTWDASYFGIAQSAKRYSGVTTAYQNFGMKNTFNPANDHYIRGAGNAECAANGIYLMTDGFPYVGDERTLFEMNNSLAGKTPLNTSGAFGLNNIRNDTGWNYMSRYAQRLRQGDQNPNGISVRVATAGLGEVFAGLNSKTVKQRKVYDCDTPNVNQHVQNLCKLGEKGYGYGEGGFSHLTDAKSIADSIQNFIDSLNKTLPTKPSGTIVIPDDPFSTKGQQAIAYLPIIDAKPSNNVAIWPGNLKKYGINEGTLIGKGSVNLFDNSKGEGEFNTSTQDWWSDKNYTGVDSDGNPITNTAIHSGGIYAHLSTPKSGLASVRTVYVEDTVSGNPVLKQFSVSSSGKIQVNGEDLTEDSFVDSNLYNGKMIGNLLQFLGFNSGTKKDDDAPQEISSNGITDIADYVDYILEQPTQAVRVLGASPHSAPVTLSYGVDLDQLGKVKEGTSKDYLLFGSMDGALHLVDAQNEDSTNNQKETFAILTKAMLTAQPDALVPSALGAGVGVPAFGVDAPWLIDENFKYDLSTSKATVEDDIMAYGGFRMGAEGLYGINLTNKNTPKIAFNLNKDVTGFERLGQIWNKPRLAKIKESDSDATGTDVLIFGGGYDTCYEDESYQVGTTTSTLTNQRGQACNRTSNTNAIGNAVYIVNAKTGDLIWSTDKLNSSEKAKLKNSVVADVVTLDRNNDGFIDHLYFADLGGQIFRIDFTNGGTSVYTGTDDSISKTPASGFAVQNFVRLYHDNSSDKKYVRRFYQKPVISMQRNTTADADGNRFNNGRLFALLNIASGDRSSPLSKMRATTSNADRVYAIFDTDVTKSNKVLYNKSNFTANTEELTDANLVNLPQEMGSSPVSAEQKSKALTAVKKKHGWYYPLVRFDGYNNVPFNKAVGKYAVIDNSLYMTVYNPDMRYGEAKSSCEATIKGASERELYCLPFGICKSDKSTNGTGGFARAGVGIQELTLGPRGASKDHRKQRVLIGTRSLEDRQHDRVDGDEGTTGSVIGDLQTNDPNNPNQPTTPTAKGGDARMPVSIATEGWVLEAKTWYDSNINDE